MIAHTMRLPARSCLLLFGTIWIAAPLMAQLPFYTDDPAVTERGKWHFEFFNEFDALQLQYPNIRQNTANCKLNYGLPFNLELDVDVPYLAIFRTVGTPNALGGGDTPRRGGGTQPGGGNRPNLPPNPFSGLGGRSRRG